MSRRILIVEDHEDTRRTLEYHLARSGFEITSAGSAEEAFHRVAEWEPDVVITDVQLPGMSGLELLNRLASMDAGADVIVVTGYQDMRTAIAAIREGAYDYLAKPVDLDQLDTVLQRCFRDRAIRRRIGIEATPDAAVHAPGYLVGSSNQMIELYKTVGMLTVTRAPVLVRGETGTGKEMVARAIHLHSPYAGEPFIAVNCTAIPEPLLESELFGHVKGAFTGAVSNRRGQFELAGVGTLFLDEIGDTSPSFQAKLLRVLQEREFQPVGSEVVRQTKARVIAATHRPIEQLIDEKKFREDLYFRLRVVEIRVPPLRERREDIPRLAEHLLAKAARELRKDVRVVSSEVMQILMEHPWPGNVRELENAMTRAVVLAHGPAISPEHLLLQTGWLPSAGVNPPLLETRPVDASHDAVESLHLRRVLEVTKGNKRRAAGMLRVSRPRLDRLLQKYTIDVREMK